MTFATTTTTNLQKLTMSGILLLVVPCSCAYISTAIATKETTFLILFIPLFTTTISLWLFIELLFYVHFLYTKNRLQQTTKPKKALNQLERASLFWNCVQTINDVSTWSEGWFYYKKDHSHPKFQDIRRENMAIW
jgi:hypothetical protein